MLSFSGGIFITAISQPALLDNYDDVKESVVMPTSQRDVTIMKCWSKQFQQESSYGFKNSTGLYLQRVGWSYQEEILTKMNLLSKDT